MDSSNDNTKTCATCEYHDDFTWACSCADSDQRGDFTDDKFVCEGWEEKWNDKMNVNAAAPAAITSQ